eukprot:PhF_6_TR786/c0_g1_i2/m.1208
MCVKKIMSKHNCHDDHLISTELQLRHDLAQQGVYSLCPEDFPSLKAFKDHEEFLESIVLDWVYGATPEVVQQAQRRYEEFCMQYNDILKQRRIPPARQHVSHRGGGGSGGGVISRLKKGTVGMK